MAGPVGCVALREWTSGFLISRRVVCVASLMLASLGISGSIVHAAQPLIPRADFFSNPERAAVSVSPDGITRSVPFAEHRRPAQFLGDARRGGAGIEAVFVYGAEIVIIFIEGDDTAEDLLVEAGDRALAAEPRARAEIIAESVSRPDEILAGLNERDPRWHDVYRINVRTGARSLVYKNNGATQFTADDRLNLRFAEFPTADGGFEIRRFAPGGKLIDYMRVPPDDSLITSLLGFDTAGTTLYALSSVGRDKVALMTLDPATAKQTVIGASDKADVVDTITHPLTGKVQAYSVEYLKKDWIAIDPAIKPDLAFIAAQREMAAPGTSSRAAMTTVSGRCPISQPRKHLITPSMIARKRRSRSSFRFIRTLPERNSRPCIPSS